MHQRSKLLAAVVAVGAAVHDWPARAAFVQLELQHYATVTTGNGTRNVYRLYAWFSDPSDYLVAWGGSLQSATTIYTGPCTTHGFFQALPYGSNKAPTLESIKAFPDVQWDTFATIGVNIADQGVPADLTSLSSGFPTFISGNTITFNNALVFTNGPQPQGRADFVGDGDPLLRVLMAQLTTWPEEFPNGNIGWLQWSSGGSMTTTTFSLWWIGAAAYGVCCKPNGQCVVTYQSSCIMNYNGFYLGCTPCGTCAQTCVPDIAPHPGNGVVDIDDLVAVITSWGPCGEWSSCPADISPAMSGNNVVDIDDLVAVITAWGACQH